MLVENALIVLIVIGVAIATDIIIVLLAKIFPKYRPTEVKLSRFEAGNPPVGTPKWVLPMQYIGFMLMFMVAEPIVVLLLLLAATPTLDVMALTLIAFILLLPSLYVAYNYSLHIAGFKKINDMRGETDG
jgi:NADH-quinone oxidoreductase subunit A